MPLNYEATMEWEEWAVEDLTPGTTVTSINFVCMFASQESFQFYVIMQHSKFYF